MSLAASSPVIHSMKALAPSMLVSGHFSGLMAIIEYVFFMSSASPSRMVSVFFASLLRYVPLSVSV